MHFTIIDSKGKRRSKKRCPKCQTALIELSAPSCRPCMFAERLKVANGASEPRSFNGIPCRSIPLTRGYVTWVDEVRFEELSRWKWHADVHPDGRVFAFRKLSPEEQKAAGRKTIRMHRQIMGDPPGRMVDHRDGNDLHNWEANLRVATTLQNHHNRVLNALTAKLPSGAYLDKRRGSYYSQIQYRGRVLYLGRFSTADEAAAAYRAKALELHGEFSVHLRTA